MGSWVYWRVRLRGLAEQSFYIRLMKMKRNRIDWVAASLKKSTTLEVSHTFGRLELKVNQEISCVSVQSITIVNNYLRHWFLWWLVTKILYRSYKNSKWVFATWKHWGRYPLVYSVCNTKLHICHSIPFLSMVLWCWRLKYAYIERFLFLTSLWPGTIRHFA